MHADEVTTTDGRRVVAETSHPKGHYRNPLTDGEVEGKFRGLASGALGAEACNRVLAEVWNLENSATLDRLFETWSSLVQEPHDEEGATLNLEPFDTMTFI